MSLKEIAQLPVEEWNGRMVNDFEESVFPQISHYRRNQGRDVSARSCICLHEWFGVIWFTDYSRKMPYCRKWISEKKLCSTKAGSLMFKNASTNILISGNKNTTRLFLQKTQNNLDYEKSSNSVFWQDYLSCCQCPLLRKDVFP